MLCEGEKMLGEALRSGAKLKTVLVRDGWDSPLVKEAEEQGASLYSAPDALFKLASEVETPQNVIFSCEQPQWTADALDGAGQVLLLDGLQDPGNLGTILRTAEAFALGAVVLCEGCADPFSPKVVRSTMGAVFRLPCVTLPLAEAAERLHKNGHRAGVRRRGGKRAGLGRRDRQTHCGGTQVFIRRTCSLRTESLSGRGQLPAVPFKRYRTARETRGARHNDTKLR